MDDLDTDWDVIGLALRERKPRYPHEAGLVCALVIAMSALNYHGWVDLGFAGIGAAIALFLVVYHRRNMRHWRKGADSFRRITGRDP